VIFCVDRRFETHPAVTAEPDWAGNGGIRRGKRECNLGRNNRVSCQSADRTRVCGVAWPAISHPLRDSQLEGAASRRWRKLPFLYRDTCRRNVPGSGAMVPGGWLEIADILPNGCRASSHGNYRASRPGFFDPEPVCRRIPTSHVGAGPRRHRQRPCPDWSARQEGRRGPWR
jgi:hypothetical protein